MVPGQSGGERTVFSINDAGTTRFPHKRMRGDPCFVFIFYFNYSWHSVLFYISFRCIALVVRQSYNSQKWSPDNSSTHLAPCIVITVLLPIFSRLNFTSWWLFSNYQFILPNSFSFFTHPPKTPPLWQPSIWSLHLCICFCCLFCSSDSTYKWNHMVFVFDLLHTSLYPLDGPLLNINKN